jgi:transmembrane sensor
MPNTPTYQDLLDGFLARTLSPEELKLFYASSQESENMVLLEAQLAEDLKEKMYTGASTTEQSERVFASALNRPPVIRTVHRVHFLKTAWVRYAAAIIILFGIGAYLWNTEQKKTPASTAEASAKVVKNDIPPGKDRAILRLSNGQQVMLDSAATETIQDGNLSIENTNGQLIYKRGDRVAMNTMSTPKGGQYQLTLAEGTKVWLNAASSITYPTAFVGTLREVSIAGEAYFEVTRNPKQAFVVKTPKEAITVLGTSFNVNAYADEEAMKTSLVEGVIKIGDTFVKPGQAYENGKVSKTDIVQDVAWKNGRFNFQDQSAEQVLRQIGRWYDLKIVFEKKPPAIRFFGSVSRDAPLSTVLELLKSSRIGYKLEGKKLIIH